MKQIEAFLEAEGLLEESPEEVVRLAASALLEISLRGTVKPLKVKKGVPIFRHRIPDEGIDRIVLVKPHASSIQAEAPASLTISDCVYSRVTFSFELAQGLVAMDFHNPTFNGGNSSASEPGRNAIRNVWNGMHLPTIAYVEQAATLLT